MKSILILSLLSFSLIARADGYNGDIMIVCDTATQKGAIVETAKNIKIQNNQAILLNTKVDSTGKPLADGELEVTKTIDLSGTTNCGFEASISYSLQ